MLRIILLTTAMLSWAAAGKSASTIECKGSECRGQTIACPEGADCKVRCEGEEACRDARFVGAPDRRMDVACEGESACESATFVGSKSLDVRCAGEDACRETELACGAQSCDWLCVDDGSCPGLVVR